MLSQHHTPASVACISDSTQGVINCPCGKAGCGGYHSQGHEILAKHLMSFDNKEEAAAVAKTGEKEGEDVISGQPHLIEVHSKSQDAISHNITLGYSQT